MPKIEPDPFPISLEKKLACLSRASPTITYSAIHSACFSTHHQVYYCHTKLKRLSMELNKCK